MDCSSVCFSTQFEYSHRSVYLLCYILLLFVLFNVVSRIIRPRLVLSLISSPLSFLLIVSVDPSDSIRITTPCTPKNVRTGIILHACELLNRFCIWCCGSGLAGFCSAGRLSIFYKPDSFSVHTVNTNHTNHFSIDFWRILASLLPAIWSIIPQPEIFDNTHIKYNVRHK